MTALESLMRRKERPLPPKGCSWAFYIFLLLLAILLFVAYLFYTKTP